MNSITSRWLTGLLIAICSTATQASPTPLNREQQLKALSMRNTVAYDIAKQSLATLDTQCGPRKDTQVRAYLDSDYQAILVALYSLLPPQVFTNLHQRSIKLAECDTLAPSLIFIKTQLKLK